MTENIEIENEENRLSDVIFALLPENNIITNRAFLYAFNGNFLKASMLSRYTHCFIQNDNQEITYKDKTFVEQYFCTEKAVKRAKKELKDEGFITVIQKGIPAIGYITVNIEKVAGILGNFKKGQFVPSGNVNLSLLYNIDNKINNNKIKYINAREEVSNFDESEKEYDSFEAFWSNVQYKSQKVIARNEWNKITNNGKNQNKIKEVGEGYERYVSFLAKERARGFDRPHMDMSTFLNPSKMRWTEEWKTEREQRQEQQPTQTENQKYWEEHENTQVIASKKVEQPKNLQLNINIARKLGLLDKFLPDEYNNEWKFLPKEIKEVLTSEVVEKAVKQIKDKEETLINQIACVTMLGREGYCNWHDKCEEETGERPLEDIEWYIPFGKKLPSGFWTWLVKYSHNFGLPSNSQVERVRKWFYTTPRSPFHFLFEQK